jgi:hypothetical protein
VPPAAFIHPVRPTTTPLQENALTLIATGIIDDLPTPLSQLRELAVEEVRARAALKTEGIVRAAFRASTPPNLLVILDVAALHYAQEQLQRLPYVQHGLLSIDVREVHER